MLPACDDLGQRQGGQRRYESPGLGGESTEKGQQGARILSASRARCARLPHAPGETAPSFLASSTGSKRRSAHPWRGDESASVTPLPGAQQSKVLQAAALPMGAVCWLERVQSQAGEQNTSKRAPRKHLSPGSLPIFQAYLQAMAQQGMSIMCSATRKAGKWRGWQIERWLGRSRARCRRGCGDPGLETGSCPRGWHCRVNVPSAVPEGSGPAPPAASKRIQGLASD